MSLEGPTALARGPLIGTFLGLALYGVTCVQAFFYFRTYKHDAQRLKMTVALLLVLETTHAVMSMWVIDDYLIVHFGNLQVLNSSNWSFMSTYILGLLIDFYVYLYFTWRVWRFAKSVWIAILMTLLSVSRTAISIIATILSGLSPTWSSFNERAHALILIGNMLFIAGDTLSACAMAYHLAKFKSWMPPNHPRTRIELLLNRLLIFCVATGALTSFVDVIALVLTLAQPNTLAFLGPILIQTRLYANSLLASVAVSTLVVFTPFSFTRLNIRNATSRAYDDAPNSPVELAGLSIHFARRSDLDTISEQDTQRANKIGVASWQTTEVASRTLPQV